MGPDIKRMTHPVSFEDWTQLLSELGLGPEGNAPVDPGAADGDGRPHCAIRDARALALIKRVELEDGFCVVRVANDPNGPSKFNAELARCVKKNGVFHDSQMIEVAGRWHYVVLYPAALQVTTVNCRKTFPPELCDRLLALCREGMETFVLIWALPKFAPKKKVMDAEDLDKVRKTSDLLGADASKAVYRGPTLVVFASKANPAAAAGDLRSRLAGTDRDGFHAIGLPDPFPIGHALRKCQKLIHSALATVVWLDASIGVVQFMKLIGNARHDRIFLLVRDGEEESWNLADRLAADVPLVRDQIFRVEVAPNNAPRREALDRVMERVLAKIMEVKDELHRRAKAAVVWEDAKRGVELILGDGDDDADDSEGLPGLDAEIVEAALLRPFQEEVDGIIREKYTYKNDTQIKFVSVTAPLYSRAGKVIALSTDYHSRFWNDPKFLGTDNQRKILKKCDTTRIFLFSDVRSLPNAVEILNFQFNYYRKEEPEHGSYARLLVASVDGYQKAFGQVLKDDVAFIRLETGAWYRFSLTRDEFGYEKLGERANDPIFADLRRIDEDAINYYGGKATYEVSPGRTFPFFPWVHDLHHHHDFVERLVPHAFGEFAGSAACRILTFRNDGRIAPEKFETLVLSVHRDLEQHALDSNSGLRAVSHGALVARGSWDGRRGAAGAPPTFDADTRTIILEFEGYGYLRKLDTDKEALEIFAKFHRGVLEALPELPEVPDDLRAAARPRDSNGLRTAAEAVQFVGSAYLLARDFLDQRDLKSLIDGMARQRPRPHRSAANPASGPSRVRG